MLHIYDTLSKQKAPFQPIEPNKIKMYVCGVTVYDLCHIGHGRVMVSFDVITRYLRARGWDVTYVRNITDVDDKIIKRAGLKPWPKPFQNLRSSRETELTEQFPIQTVVSWIGNSPNVALQSYLQVRESDFEKALHISCSPVLSTVDQA
mgnify:CR=1 FL=1